MERRKLTRVPLEAEIRLKKDAAEIFSKRLRDISMGGVFVITDVPFNIGDFCSLKLSLIGQASLLTLTMTGEVVRVEEEGMALIFNDMDIDTFMHLKHFIKLFSQDSDKIDEECTSCLFEVE